MLIIKKKMVFFVCVLGVFWGCFCAFLGVSVRTFFFTMGVCLLARICASLIASVAIQVSASSAFLGNSISLPDVVAAVDDIGTFCYFNGSFHLHWLTAPDHFLPTVYQI